LITAEADQITKYSKNIVKYYFVVCITDLVHCKVNYTSYWKSKYSDLLATVLLVQ